jgi:hypothetical protein
MGAVVKLIRHAPRAGLEAFLAAQDCPLGEQLRGIGADVDHVAPLLKAVDELSDEEHARLTVNAERVTGLADEAGQTALLAVVRDRQLVEGLEGACARSLWAFLNEPASFRRAEEVRHTDRHREGRMWSGYAAPKGLAPATSEATLAAFKARAIELFGSLEGHCEIYRRTRPSFDAPDAELFQLTLYRDDLPDSFFVFEAGRLVRRHRRPVVEVSVTYEPATGVIEVVSPDRKKRDALARLFADTVLGRSVEGERIQLREFDLRHLLEPFDFAFDPADGIESVALVLLRVQRPDSGGRRTTLEVPRRAAGSTWDHARKEMRHGDLAAADYIATQVKLSIRFLPGGGSRRGKTLDVTITVPNGCDLKERTERERLIGGKYLKRWGLVAEI